MNCTTRGTRLVSRILQAAVPLSIILFLATTAVRAGAVTYDVISNPQPDIINGSPYLVNVTGTMSIPVGTYNSTNDAGVDLDIDLTMSTNAPGVSPVTVVDDIPLTTAFNIVTSGELFATPTSLSVGSDTYFTLSVSGINVGDPYMSVLYDTHDTPGYYNGYAGYTPSAASMQFENTNANADYVVDGEWEIATAVPEPGTLLLLATALAGVVLLQLPRRRRALARVPR